MEMLAGISGFIFLFLMCMKIDYKEKKQAFLQISFFSMLLLLSDRYAYLYRGDVSTFGYYMVRVANFLVYASIIFVDNGFTNYLLSLSKLDAKKTKGLIIAKRLAGMGIFILVISQFTGLYYVFDEPIALFPNVKKQLKAMKDDLTYKMWDWKSGFFGCFDKFTYTFAFCFSCVQESFVFIDKKRHSSSKNIENSLDISIKYYYRSESGNQHR